MNESLLKFIKVCDPQEMARVEKLSIQDGASAEAYMMCAGERLSEKIQDVFFDHGLKKNIHLFIGKGNNGGDAFVAGNFLLKQGFNVKAFCLFKTEDCSDLSQKFHEKFLAFGGEIVSDLEKLEIEENDIVIDGLLGTGFKGDLSQDFKDAIDCINRSKAFVVSIDIPSGLDGSTGDENGVVEAKDTLALGTFKSGMFLNKGYKAVGRLSLADFGMEEKYLEMMEVTLNYFDESCVKEAIPKIERTRHKYESGYVLGVAGSEGMSGAAMLCMLSALRSGSGIVRLFHDEAISKDLSASFVELIKNVYSKETKEEFYTELQRAKALIVGPGARNSQELLELIDSLFKDSSIQVPMVVDADALEVFARAKDFKGKAILTPHRAELKKLLSEDLPASDKDLLHRCQKFVDERKECVLVLKGAPTFIFAKNKLPTVMAFGDPGMATAGSGDVLSGVLGAMLSQGLEPFSAACLGVYLHGKAGEAAAREKSSYSLVASDIIDALPQVFVNLGVNRAE